MAERGSSGSSDLSDSCGDDAGRVITHSSRHSSGGYRSTSPTHTLPQEGERRWAGQVPRTSSQDGALQRQQRTGGSSVATAAGATTVHALVGPSPTDPAPGPDVRDTAEYQAAWDLELWKAVQAERFRKDLEKQKTAALANLGRLVKHKEKEARASLQQRTTAVALREEAVGAEETRLAEREQRVVEMEKDVRRMRQQLLDAQQRVEDEVRTQVRLANETIAHRARLLEERVKAGELQVRRADERQRQAQQEYLTLYETFSRYRTQQLTAPPGEGGAPSSAVIGASSSSLPLQLEQLRVQWGVEHQLQTERQEQRHASQMATAQQRCKELEEQNRRLTAALARRREQLRSRSEETAPLMLPTALQKIEMPGKAMPEQAVLSSERPRMTHVPTRAAAAAGAGASAVAPSSPPPDLVSAAVVDTSATGNLSSHFNDEMEKTTRELRRLEHERSSLVEGSRGALRETDTVIVRIDSRMRELRERLTVMTATQLVTGFV